MMVMVCFYLIIGDEESETVKGDDMSFSIPLLDCFLHFFILHDSKIELDLEAAEALSSSDGTLSYKRSFSSKISSCLICLRFKLFF